MKPLCPIVGVGAHSVDKIQMLSMPRFRFGRLSRCASMCLLWLLRVVVDVTNVGCSERINLNVDSTFSLALPSIEGKGTPPPSEEAPSLPPSLPVGPLFPPPSSRSLVFPTEWLWAPGQRSRSPSPLAQRTKALEVKPLKQLQKQRTQGANSANQKAGQYKTGLGILDILTLYR